MDSASLTYVDFGEETSTMKINTVDIDDTNLLTVSGELAALATAVDGIALGSLVRSGQSIIIPTGNAAPANALAQREIKWLVVARATTAANADLGRLYTYEIPCADLSLLVSGSDTLFRENQTTVPAQVVTDFNTAFEAIAKSPQGSDLEVVRISVVGRNL